MLYIGDEFRRRMDLLNLDVNTLSDDSFVEIDDIKKIMHNDISYEEIDEFDLKLLCGVLHCKPEYFTNEDVKKRDLLNSSMNRGNDDNKSKKVKAKIQDFMNDFEFINDIVINEI